MKKLSNLYLIIVFFFLYMPILVLILFSFNNSASANEFTGLSLQWYKKFLHNPELINALTMSLSLAAISALASSILGTIAAYALYKYGVTGKKIFAGLFSLPMLTPDIVLGIGLLLLFSILHFSLGYFSILLAHITFSISYCTLIVSTRFSHIDTSLEDAAADLGAKPMTAFTKIIIPTIFPGILASFLIAFTLSWDDFIIAYFNSGIGSSTLPIRVYSMIRKGIDPQINAVSTLTLVVSIFTALIAFRIQKKFDLIITSNT